MSFGNYYGGYQQSYCPPGGAMPDMLNQYKHLYQPAPQTPQQQGGSGLLWVQGETGAKSFLVAPGQSALLMDSESMRFYLKSADASGMPMPLRVFEYSEVTGQAPAASDPAPDMGLYVTRDEFERRLSEMYGASKEEEKK